MTAEQATFSASYSSKATSDPIGECKLYGPDADGIARTDVKLLPEFLIKTYKNRVFWKNSVFESQ